MKYLYLLILLFPVACFAQFNIEGKVVNVNTGTPVPNASVFINNTTIGAKADTSGFFKLSDLKQGQYELIVSSVGYETYRQTLVINQNMVLPHIKMQPYTLMANEVTIVGKDSKHDKKLKMFKEQFLGRDIFWKDCKIVNPEVLKLTLSKSGQVLTASTNDFLEIENNALGYKLKYLLSDFVLDKELGRLKYEGSALFEEKEGTSAQKEKWEENRHLVYYGSVTHFLRTILANTTDSDFVVRPFCIRSFEQTIKIPRVRVINPEPADTTKYLMAMYDTLRMANYIHKTKQKGVYAINYPEDLDVFYFPPGVPHDIDQDLEDGNYGQIGSFNFIDENILFDIHGIILNPTGALFRYKWGTSRVAELLPINYLPPIREVKKKKNL
ncbi:MAG: carboxypeptidase-like regulatory domain-containing protein [Bacteroidota bacterium]